VQILCAFTRDARSDKRIEPLINDSRGVSYSLRGKETVDSMFSLFYCPKLAERRALHVHGSFLVCVSCSGPKLASLVPTLGTLEVSGYTLRIRSYRLLVLAPWSRARVLPCAIGRIRRPVSWCTTGAPMCTTSLPVQGTLPSSADRSRRPGPSVSFQHRVFDDDSTTVFTAPDRNSCLHKQPFSRLLIGTDA